MIAERDTDSVAPTPTSQHPHQSQHHHLSLHELRVLQVKTIMKSICLIFFSFIPTIFFGNLSFVIHNNTLKNSKYFTVDNLICFNYLQRRPAECTGNSSSDENRSSGHASMSDTGGHTSSSSPPHRHNRCHSPQQQLNAVPEDDRLSASVTQRNGRNRSGQTRNRHRATPAKVVFFNSFILLSFP